MMVKLKDIAERVGTSSAVVSSVLNNRLGKIRVSEEKRLQILKVADEMGYTPNRSARALVTRLNRSLGLVVGYPVGSKLTIHDHAYAFSILSGMHNECDPMGYRCVYAPGDMRDMTSFVLPDFIRDRSVDGLVLGGYVGKDVEQCLEKEGIPLIHIGTNLDQGSKLRSVSADMVRGTLELIDLAAQNGVKSIHIYMPGGPGPLEITQSAATYVKRTYPDLELTTYNETKGLSKELSREHGYLIGKGKNPPELVITSVSYVDSLYGGLADSGVNCPEQVQIVAYAGDGYHNELLGHTNLKISQIVLPYVELGELAARLMIQKLRDAREPVDTFLNCYYLKGSTTKF